MRPCHIHTTRRTFITALGLGALASRTGWSDDAVLAVEDSEYATWEEVAREGHTFEHWTPEENSEWAWYRLERYMADEWKTVGISLPSHRQSGEPLQGQDGYVPLEKIPEHVLSGELPTLSESIAKRMAPSPYVASEAALRRPDPVVQSREGRPGSDWLLRLRAQDLRSWLPTIEPEEARVNGMTFWVHLIRDHGFDPRCVDGLSEAEFLRLHSAAHEGY